MRRNTILGLALGFLVALAAAAWFLVGSGAERAPLATENDAATDRARPALAPDAAQLADADTRALSAQEPARTGASTERRARAEGERCTVLGRLVDEHGVPIAAAAVRIAALDTRTESVAAPRRELSDGSETATDASGRFRLTVPVQTSARTALSIRPDRFHEALSLVFAESGDRTVPALTAGTRDLGELRVASTGALTGRVLDAQGQPVADVELGIGEMQSTSFERGVRSSADGRYVIPHAPVGTYGVRAKSRQHLDVFEPGLTVVAGVDTVVRDLVLTLAPTLAGTVVDEHGQALAGVRVTARSVHDGSESIGASEADGRFVVALRADAPHQLSAELDGFVRSGAAREHSATYEPGRRDIALVLHALPRMKFKVVDADGGAPIERFALALVPGDGSAPASASAAPRSRAADHPGGIVETGARPGIDSVVVEAAECVPWIGRVKFDAPDVPLQTVRLSRGAAIGGRALRDGAPLANALVEAVRITAFALKEDGTYDTVRHHVDGDTRRSARTDADGRFRVSALQGGDYRLTVRPESGAPLVRAPVHVRPREATDVGELDVVAGGTIVGELLAPAGFDPAGLRVFLDDPDDGVTVLVDGAGHFRFENVPAGVRFVGYEPRAGTLAPLEPVRVELAAGATESVTLDARARALCAVELHVELGEFAAAGAEVELVPADGAGRPESLGNCDAAGRVRGAVRAFGKARVGVRLAGAGLTLHPSAVLELAPFGKVAASVKFEFARLELRVRGALPRDGRLTARFAPRTEGLAVQNVTLRFVDGSAASESALLTARADGVSIGGLAPGSWSLTVQLFGADAELTYSATAELELAPGQTLALEL